MGNHLPGAGTFTVRLKILVIVTGEFKIGNLPPASLSMTIMVNKSFVLASIVVSRHHDHTSQPRRR